MNDSTIALDFSFLGTNHQVLNQHKDTHQDASLEQRKYKRNTLQGFLIDNVLNNINPGIYELAYIPNISPIDIFLQNLNAGQTIWISCHKQPVRLNPEIEYYIVHSVYELLYLLHKLRNKDVNKKTVFITHLSYIINSHLLDLIKHNNQRNTKISINDYKCKLLISTFQTLSKLFDKAIVINNFMNAKNSDHDSYVLKSELENGIAGKGVLDQVWKRMLILRIGIYNNIGGLYSMKLVVESGSNLGVQRVHTLYQFPEDKEPPLMKRESEHDNTDASVELDRKSTSVMSKDFQHFKEMTIADSESSDDMIDDSQY
ncbi:hypothetical protein ACO0R3_002712 [Hanseniaspora guilliermondii]